MQPVLGTSKKIRVLGVGLAIIDYIASVDHHPAPDEKIRSQALECVGGGNCYNALSTLSSMGVATTIVSKVGADPHGKKVIELCKQKNIGTQHVVIDENMNTAFSFIMADVARGTRTIVHNPGNESNVENTIENTMLDNMDLIYLDGRFTKAALRIAALSRARPTVIPLLLDCERARGEEFEELRRQAHYLIASRNYIKLFMEDADQGDQDREVKALERLLLASNNSKWVILTLGDQGSLSLQKFSPDLISATSVKVPEWPGLATVLEDTPRIQLTDIVRSESVAATEEYINLKKFTDADAPKQYLWKDYFVQYCPALCVDSAGVGAGDKFIAGLAAGVLLKNTKVHPDVPHLALGTLVAAIGLSQYSLTFDWSKIF